MDTLSQARVAWQDTITGKGGYCPCCDRWGKVYRYKISESNAKALIWMSRATPTILNMWLDMPRQAPKWVVATNSFSLMEWWKLIDRRPMEIDDQKQKKFSGHWRVTNLGREFVAGNLQLPKYVYIYNDRLQGVSTETITIKDCFGEDFNYEEMMSTTMDDFV